MAPYFRPLFRAGDNEITPMTTHGADFEKTVRRLATIIGHGNQGTALARELAREGARTRADLRRPDVLPRLPRGSQSSVLFNPARNVPLAAAQAVAAEIKRRLVFDLGGHPRRFEVIPVGSVRRQVPRVKDIDFLVVLPAGDGAEFERVLAAAALRPPRPADRVTIADTYATGSRRRSFVLRAEDRGQSGRTGARAQHYRSDFFVTTADEKPYALYHYTGSRDYNIRTRAHAKRLGWLLNQYGLFDAATGRRVRGTAAIRSERDLARFLGVTYRAPRDRDEDARSTSTRSRR
jgi:DNA polymerase/3'-5' exonuclease PolX